ncbi:hypothetical protein M758_11G066100 [Ceratodon purpureus]|nr:hypothetical protein M758_11G066100 [Ceratodon purpureus]
MRREGRVRGKPSNKSRNLGREQICHEVKGRRCRLGDHCCRDFIPERPGEKSWVKRKQRSKRHAGDVCTNPALSNFFLQPGWLTDFPLEVRVVDGDCFPWCSICNAKEERLLSMQERNLNHATVNNLIEAAFADVHGSCGDEYLMTCATCELSGGALNLAGDATDVDAIELAFQRVLGIFENAVEGSRLSEYATQGWSTLSEESWLDVELLESGEETLQEIPVFSSARARSFLGFSSECGTFHLVPSAPKVLPTNVVSRRFVLHLPVLCLCIFAHHHGIYLFECFSFTFVL